MASVSIEEIGVRVPAPRPLSQADTFAGLAKEDSRVLAARYDLDLSYRKSPSKEKASAPSK